MRFHMTKLPKNLWLFIWNFLRAYKLIVVIYVCIAATAGFMGPINSILLKYIIDSLSKSYSQNLEILFLPAVLLILNFIVLDNFTWRSIGYINYKYQATVKNKIIHDTYESVLASPQTFFHDNFSGRIASHITTIADNVIRILYPITPNFIRNFSLLIVSLVLVFHVNINFFYTMVLWAILFFSFSFIMSTYLVRLSDNHADSESAISGGLVDSITNASNVRLFAKNTYELSYLDKLLNIRKEKFKKEELFILIMNSIQGALIALMLGVMIFFLIHLYKIHQVTVGDFALILGITMEISYITWFTMSQVNEFHQAVGKCRQSLTSLIVPHDIHDKDNANHLLVQKGQITFLEVKFNYKGMESLFQNKSIRIEGGQKVGLVGYSGGGKSTFVNLILRLYDVSCGQILIDGQDIRDVTQESLRNQIGMIPQDPTLFHRTLMENIRYGRIEATDEEVIEASKKAHAHEFIIKLPQGYDSPVGERGVKLSGGQRQRIAIARAILKNPPILMLDEATSQLDSVTEKDIQDSLWELMQDKTAIVIAHRLSTLLHMDRILVFDQGKIVEDGLHADLLAKGGLYKTLWEAQVGGFLAD